MNSIKTIIINDYRDVLKGTEYYDKYLIIQEDYYKRLGEDYEEVKMKINGEISPEEMKNLLISLVNKNICLDEYILDYLLKIKACK